MRRAYRRAGVWPAFGLLGAFAIVASCHRTGASGRPHVAVSIFPLYDIARRVAGERLEVSLVLPAGRSEHSYDPSPREMARVADARLGLSIGLGMDDWLERIIRGAAGNSVRMVRVGPMLQPRPFTHQDVGEEEAEEHARTHGDGHGEHEHEHGPLDPHVWLDPVRMADAADRVADAFAALDAPGAAGFRARAGRVRQELLALHARIEQRARGWTHRTIVTFHGSMGYFAERYGLTVAAVIEPFPGQEPSARYLATVVSTIRGTQAAALFSEPQLDRRPGERVAQEAGVRLFELDPIGGGPGAESYEALFDRNASVLDRALR